MAEVVVLVAGCKFEQSIIVGYVHIGIADDYIARLNSH
jgi:hypothetical protein